MINKNMDKLAVVGPVLIALISLVFLVSALTSDERQSLQSELDNLIIELSNQGYSWFINPNNYNLNFGGNI